jgi:hypothetical protein
MPRTAATAAIAPVSFMRLTTIRRTTVRSRSAAIRSRRACGAATARTVSRIWS